MNQAVRKRNKWWLSPLTYIHLNPVKLIDPKWKENGITDKIQAKEYLNSYLYSSYPLFYLDKNKKSSN